MDATHRVQLTGALSAVRFPSLCARCGAPPAGTLPLAKLFRRTYSESPTTHLVDQTDVPFCAPCLATHERERRPVDPRVLRGLRNGWLLKSLVYAVPIAVSLFFVKELVPDAVRAAAAGNHVRALGLAGFAAFFGLLLWMFVRMVLAGRGPLIAQYVGETQGPPDVNAMYAEVVRGPLGTTCVLPGQPTSTLAAVDFTDELFAVFEPNKRTFTFANLAVATEFAAANADLVWDPRSPRAERAGRVRRVVLVVAGGAAAAFFLYELVYRLIYRS